MNSVAFDPAGSVAACGLRRTKDFVWRHPEWWSLALWVVAWLAMLQPHAHHRGPMTQWLLMTVAMMMPVVANSIRATAELSLWRRRHRAITGFLAGYIGCWLAVGAVCVVARVQSGPSTAAAAFAIAGGWQLTRAKRLALSGCHVTAPLAPRGWRADRDCVRYGWLIGSRCIASCWALMLACFAAGHSLPAMAGLAAVTAVERYTRRPNHALLAGVLVAAAFLYLPTPVTWPHPIDVISVEGAQVRDSQLASR